MPDSPAANALVRIATDIALGVPAIRAAQEKIAADRQSRMTERIAGLEAKIASLK